MRSNWRRAAKKLRSLLKNVLDTTTEAVKAYSGLAHAALRPNALETKTEELMALGIAVAARCDSCITFHAEAAIDLGATQEEVSDVIRMTICMGCGQ